MLIVVSVPFGLNTAVIVAELNLSDIVDGLLGASAKEIGTYLL